MSIIKTSRSEDIPNAIAVYGLTHAAEGKIVLVYRRKTPCTLEESYDFIATGVDRDKDVLAAKGYKCIHMYTPYVAPAHDRTFEPPYNERCC